MSPSTEFVIRRARRADTPALGRLGGLLLRVHYEFDRQRFLAPGDDPEGGYAWFLGSQLEEEDVVVFVAERSGAATPPDAANDRRVPLPWPERSRRQPDQTEGDRSVRLEPDQTEHGRTYRRRTDDGAQGQEDSDRLDSARADERDIVGYVYAGLEPLSWKELRDAAGFIHDVVVAADARGHGVATMLVEAAIEWLREKGTPRVMLWTAEKNVEAQQLFTRVGFRRTMVEMTREL